MLVNSVLTAAILFLGNYSLFRSSVVWNVVSMHKASQKTTDSGTGRNSAGRKGKPYLECIFILARANCSPLQDERPPKGLAGPPVVRWHIGGASVLGSAVGRLNTRQWQQLGLSRGGDVLVVYPPSQPHGPTE